MLGAMAAVQNKGSSINRNAKLFGVPLSTLKDRLSGRVVHGVKPGPVPYLSPEEEDELEDYVLEPAQSGMVRPVANSNVLLRMWQLRRIFFEEAT